MEERFDTFIKVILDHEGGIVNDPDDLGGYTNMGITRRRYPEMDIKNLTVAQAKQIYYDDFYKPLKLYRIKDDLLALHVFDMAINAGKINAVKILQDILNGCDSDGSIGPITQQSIANADITTDLAKAYIAKRIEYYYKVSKRRNNKKYLAGWVNRVYKTKLDA